MDTQWLAAQFEQTRAHLRNVAFRMLGSAGDADDAVQETWLRLSRADTSDVTNLGGWLTTVTARVCLDMLRARKIRRTAIPDVPAPAQEPDPARDVMLADSIGAALLVVLETLAPAERVAFVLHDLFDLPFDEIARIIDRSEAATRQLASRARRRVQRKEAPPAPDAGRADHALVDAFFAAARGRDLTALLAVLDPDVVLRVDDHALQTAASTKWAQQEPALQGITRGAGSVARMLSGRAGGATRATIDGEPGAAWVPGGEIRSAFVFTIDGGRITAIDIVMEPDALAELDIELVT